jgi:hypothetical protein
MACFFENVFSCKAPMAPAEIADFVKSTEVECCFQVNDWLKCCFFGKRLRQAWRQGGSVLITKELRTCRFLIFKCKASNALFLCGISYPFEKFTMIAWSVRAKVFKDISQRGFWHGYLKEIVAKGNLLKLVVCCGRSVDGDHFTIESLAPLSPRNDRGSSLTPS